MTSVALALLAGFLFAWAASLQQQAGRASLPTSPVQPLGRLQVWLPITGALHCLLRHPMWLTGWAVNLGGFITQAVALHTGSVALVQPVLVTQLLFTIPIAALHTRCRPAPKDFAAGAAVCLGVGLFVASWGTREGPSVVDRPRVLSAVLAALGLALVLVARASRMRPAIRAIFASVAAGLCFAVSAVLMKLTFDSLVNEGVGATAHDWCGYLLAVSTGLGLIIGQDALAAGALSTAVAGMAITNPVASAVIGVLGFHESVHTSAVELAGLSMAGLFLVAGVIGLAQSATIRADARDSEAHRVTRMHGSVTSWAHGLTP
jgi:drug/metabolite transporter (DMT)-like permease